jgi:assimilatory nitrate reductase catalytic subunit
MSATRTTCPYCGVGCGVLATPDAGGGVAVAGDPDHPANFGKLCSKGSALGETLGLADRLLFPEIGGKRASWDAALELVAQRFAETVRAHGPDSVAFYVSGQILTEDYYVANKLMKGFIGSANIDTNSRLCMASSVAGHRRAFGSDTVPGLYADFAEAECVVLVGSNLAWCHPVLFQRLMEAREKRAFPLVVIDPRRTVTAEAADLHLALEPDSDVPLFLGLLNHLDREGLAAPDWLAEHVDGAEAALEAARGYDIPRTARETGLAEREIAAFFALFAATDRVVTIYSQGVNQSVSGTDKVNAILNCHLLTGRIGRPGCGPFSVTGQPNAMGGREVGGLANMLAAHMAIEDEAARNRVQRFWASPVMATKLGLKAVDLFRAIGEGKVKAVWIMGTNPVDSLPDADGVAEALSVCPFVVVSDVVRETDTNRFAHVLLPAAAWGEKSGTVTNSERRISRQRSFLPLPGEAKPDWWIVSAVARRMGFSGFDYAHPAEIFREHAALSGFENAGTRDFDISAHADVSVEEYEALPPFLWPQALGESPRESRFFSDGQFYTPDRKARMVPTPVRAEVKFRDDNRPLWLNTGRIRDQWHTMTRTAKAPRLMGHFGEPFCEIHPADAAKAGIAPASLVEVESEFGRAILRALVTDRQRRGSVYAPMHWTGQFASKGRANALTHPATDPVSGQPGLKRVAVSLRPFAATWFGFAVSARRPVVEGAEYWALAPLDRGFRLELAGREAPADWQAFGATLFGLTGAAEWTGFYDSHARSVRLAAFEGDRLMGALFVSPEPVALSRAFLSEALGESHAGAGRIRLLAGLGGAERPDPGATICACFQVGLNSIIHAIREGGATTVEAIGHALKAGTNCGSCRSEIRRIIDAHRFEKAI